LNVKCPTQSQKREEWGTRFRMKKYRKDSAQSGAMRLRIERAIRAIPRGKVSTYGGIAKMAGYPGAARMVAQVLRRGFGLPWQRVLGAGGAIKLMGDSEIEQRLRLEAEGVRFRGRKVDMNGQEFKISLPKKAKSRPTTRSAKKKS
jgi:methylated-DNA-protein-cysteine methyltransferase related protein